MTRADRPSYCTECDTLAEPCPEHPTARRYLEPITYEPGGIVPEHELERCQHPVTGSTPAPSSGAARPLEHLIADLENWVFLSDALEATVRFAYALNAKRTTRLVEKVVAGAREQTLGNPDGYLAKHAGAMGDHS